MIYTESFEGIRLDIQTVYLEIGDEIKQQIRDLIMRLQRHISEITWVDAYFKRESSQSTDKRTIGVRLGIPGNDAFATATGDQWKSLLKEVEGKLRRQLRKRKKENNNTGLLSFI